PDIAGILYVATDIGVFQTSDGGKQWVTLSTGLPKVLVRALNLHRASRTLRAVTHGRSMWDLAVPAATPSLAPHIDSATLSSAASAAAAAGPLIPGSISSLYGRNLAPEVAVSGAAPLPYTLGGVILELNGIPAPLFFVSPGQINSQVPWDLEGHNRATLVLTNGTQSSTPLQANVSVAAPTIFTVNGVGSGQGAAIISGT